MIVFDSIEDIIVATAEAVRPPERLTVSEAAERYRYLNNPGSYVGLWQNSKTPYMVEPMDVLTSLNYTGMVFAGPARTGKSDSLLNWIAHTAITDPADMMVVAMTQTVARDWSQGDLAKFFRHSKDVGSRLTPGRQNDNVHDKKFMSGMRLQIKWPVISELSGKTVPRVWFMDYDRMSQDIDKEGNPYDLGKKRTQTFGRYGMTVAEASPGFDVENAKWVATSPHEAPPTQGILSLYNRGDRRRWHWQCPQCRNAFEPSFKLLSWPTASDPLESAEQVVLGCPHCGFPMTPDMQFDLNLGGRWVKEGMTWQSDGSMVGTPRRSEIASFWMKGPAAAFTTWPQLVLKYLVASEEYARTGDEGPLKTTINTDQGEPYTSKAIEAGRLPEDLKSRAEQWGGSRADPVVPAGVRFLVATVDVQARSFVVQVHGFGVGGDIWLIDMFKIRKAARTDQDGDPLIIDPAGFAEDWQMLRDQVINRSYPLADGSGRMMVKLTGCDSGGREGVTSNAYAFWRGLRDSGSGEHLRFQLLKGEPKTAAPRYRIGYPDAQKRDKLTAARGDVPVGFINSNMVKDTAFAMLGRTEPGGGMVHFPRWFDENGREENINWLYTQLTTEIRSEKGWTNSANRRNEAWDLLYYAIALGLDTRLRVEHIDWAAPPEWAEDWPRNSMVFSEDAARPFVGMPADDDDWEELANLLA